MPAAKIAPPRSRRHVAVLDKRSSLFRRARTEVETEERLGAHRAAPGQEFVRAELVRLDGIPRAIEDGWARSRRTDAVEPVVSGDEVAARDIARSGRSASALRQARRCGSRSDPRASIRARTRRRRSRARDARERSRAGVGRASPPFARNRRRPWPSPETGRARHRAARRTLPAQARSVQSCGGRNGAWCMTTWRETSADRQQGADGHQRDAGTEPPADGLAQKHGCQHDRQRQAQLVDGRDP